MSNDKQFLDAINQIDAVLGEDKDFAGVEDLCKLFNQIKGVIETILPFIDKIPVYGSTMAKALRLLLQLGSLVCPK
ncbi:hypothetical protein [Pedomonas sp. V897]|uniref:hypothetical protein n=1 Tax=Pedomonas sp. V897 TaxID=3446482 RepID=UPI003EDEB7EB